MMERNQLRFPARFAASLAALSLPLALSACGRALNADFLYVTAAGAATGGTVFSYGVDENSAYISFIGDNTYNSGGLNTQSSVATGDAKWYYTMNNQDDTIVEFGVRVGEGTVTPLNTYNTTGTLPSAINRDSSNSFLYVTDSAGCFTTSGVQNCFSNVNPGVGDLTVFSIDSSTGALTNLLAPASASPTNYQIGWNPEGVAATPSGAQFVYVANAGGIYKSGTPPTTSPLQPPSINAFTLCSSTSTSTPCVAAGAAGAANSFYAPLQTIPAANLPSGAKPWAVYATSTTVYITDYANAAVYWYSINADGTLPAAPTGQVVAGAGADAITTDPSGKFLYVANYQDGTIYAYDINGDGSLSQITDPALSGPAVYTAGAGAKSMAVTTQAGPFLFVSNYVENSVNGFLINSDGTLTKQPRFPITVNGTHISSVAVVPRDPGSNSQ